MSGLKLFFILLICAGIIVYLLMPSKQSVAELNPEYNNTADSILTYSLHEKTGYKWLEQLCEIGPRLSGSENSQKAIEWAENKLNEIGCDSVWLQPVMVPRWVRGSKEKGLIVKSETHEGKKLSVASLGGSIGTGGRSISGKIIEVKKFEDVKKLTFEDTNGKIFLFNEPFDESLNRTFSAYGKAVKQRAYGAIEAAKLGGIAAVVRSVTSKNDNVPHVGMMMYADSINKIPAVAIGVQDAELLSTLLADDPDMEISLELDCENLAEVESYNVIAEIRGSEFPDEIVVVGGHYDSWDKGHGAHDDGAGCLQSMEVLEQMIALNLNPKRTIRCVLFINEENGLRGGLKYGEYSDYCTEKHIAAVESDRGAFMPRGFSVDANEQIISDMNKWLPLLQKFEIDWIRKGGSGADISKIKGTTALIGYVPDDQRYFDFHHSANDVFETVNAREMQLGTGAITMLTYLISQEGL